MSFSQSVTKAVDNVVEKYITTLSTKYNLPKEELMNLWGGKEVNTVPTNNGDLDPVYLAKALKETGFTHISVYNNHSFDHGYSGHQRTIQILEDAKLEVLQLQKIYNIGDYKVEIANFTTHINNKEISDSDLSSMTNTNPIADISADFNIAYVHWGGQYTENEIQEQKRNEALVTDIGTKANA